MFRYSKPIFPSILSLIALERAYERKKITYKIHVYSDLKHKLRKRQKKVNKKLVEVNKGGTFAPAIAHKFITILAGKVNQGRKFIF